MTKAGSKGGNLRDKLDGNELDLSLSDLNEVPVKELAALPKATILDLSCNKLNTLPTEFCGLTHLVKLDLSKNKLQQLPADFGRLVNLQHLDLLNNRLVTLPVSFAQLKSLKWLDLKDNPLDPVLAKVAGDCLDEKQCKQCANKVLQHMKAMQADQEREKQRRLEVEREAEKKREAKQRAKEAQERELRKREKAEEKERRRKEYDALKASKREQEKKPKKETNQAPISAVSGTRGGSFSVGDGGQEDSESEASTTTISLFVEDGSFLRKANTGSNSESLSLDSSEREDFFRAINTYHQINSLKKKER
uniref:Leucine-rich repeat-containing protein 59 n=1 Tax=Rhinolophus ferrumequinum TaxID=59479 RepID=A0A671GAI0_RHIFE